MAKNQKSCGSCSAFAQVAMAETSLLKAGAKKDSMDLSEDWLINCRQDGADVCKGAHIEVYAKYMIKTEKHLNSVFFKLKFEQSREMVARLQQEKETRQ